MIGVGVFALSIYLLALTKHFNRFNMGFMGIAFFICVLAVSSWYMKKSNYTLLIYLLVLFGLFVAETIATVILLFERDEMVAWAMEHVDDETQDSIEEIELLLNDNIKLATYLLLVT